MRKRWIAIALSVACAAAAGAQDHTDGWYLAGATGPDLMLVDGGGNPTTVLVPSALPGGGVAVTVCHDIDNSTLIVAYRTAIGGQGGVAHFDASGVMLSDWRPNGGGMVNGVALDRDGNYVVLVSGGTGARLLSVDRVGREVTLSTGAPMVTPTALTIDIETGDYIVAQSSLPNSVLRIPRLGGAGVPIATMPLASGNQVSQDLTNGDLYVASIRQPFSTGAVLRASRAGPIATFIVGSILGTDRAVHLERASSPQPSALACFTATGYVFARVDLATQGITTLATLTGFASSYASPRHGRNTVTVQRATRMWDVLINHPGDRGRNYALVLSLTPPFPGVPLPDGRRIAFTPDALSTAGLAGALGPLLRNYTGALNASGRAVATIDLRSIPPVTGIPIWIQLVTLDPAAPLGLQTIVDPIVLVT